MKIVIGLILGVTLSLSSGGALCQSNEMVKIKGGTFVPLYGSDSLLTRVDDYFLDVYPVTRANYLEFVKNTSKWQRSKVVRLFADENYLRLWKGDLTLNDEISPNAPITNVSWFAAKSYCESKGKRLPTMDEWEYAAMASEKKPDAREDSMYNQYILSWYEEPKTFDNEIGQTFKNYWGVYDLHGLVWEWTPIPT